VLKAAGFYCEDDGVLTVSFTTYTLVKLSTYVQTDCVVYVEFWKYRQEWNNG